MVCCECFFCVFVPFAQALLTGVDRDALSGWGCVVKILTPDRIITCVVVVVDRLSQLP